MKDEQTFGERAVGLNPIFDPSGSEEVEACKAAFAVEIDRMDTLRNKSSGERARLAAVAITQLQTAQMWAVKALTWRN